MIWLKRLLPLVVLLAGWFAWKGITHAQQERILSEDNRYALVTAQAWVASSVYRENPAGYLAYRDSLLQANNITSAELFRHLELFEQDMDRQLAFSQTVSRLVDSLLSLIPLDSSRSVRPHSPTADSSGGVPSPDTAPLPNRVPMKVDSATK